MIKKTRLKIVVLISQICINREYINCLVPVNINFISLTKNLSKSLCSHSNVFLYRHHSASTYLFCLRSGIDNDNGPRGKEAELSSFCNPSSENTTAISDFNSF